MKTLIPGSLADRSMAFVRSFANEKIIGDRVDDVVFWTHTIIRVDVILRKLRYGKRRKPHHHVRAALRELRAEAVREQTRLMSPSSDGG